MLQPMPTAAVTWPIPADAPDLKTIVQAQAVTMADQAALIDAYQIALGNAQGAAPTTATGTATGTSLALTNIAAGPVRLGAVVTGIGIPATPPTTIIGQLTGTTGQAGTYVTSQATTATNAALTLIPGGGPSNWPTPGDSNSLMAIQQAQTLILRSQTSLLQQYQNLLNVSQTPAPPTGP